MDDLNLNQWADVVFLLFAAMATIGIPIVIGLLWAIKRNTDYWASRHNTDYAEYIRGFQRETR